MTATHTDSPAQAAFRDYAATGDVTGFWALADYLDEQGGQKRFTRLLRAVAKKRDPDVAFFYAQHGACFVDDLALGLRSAVDLAKAEDWFEEREFDGYPGWDGDPTIGLLHFRWEEDEDYDPNDADVPMPAMGWVGILQHYVHGWYTVASLGAVTFAGDGSPDDDGYGRVVRAELCLEAMREKR